MTGAGLSIEERLTRIEDLEAIRSLTNAYHFAVNEGDHEAIWPLFTEDAFVQLSSGAQLIGNTAVRSDLKKTLDTLKMIKQFIHGHSVTVDGTTAEGVSFLDARYARRGDPTSYMVAGKLNYSYRKEDGRWRICRYIIELYFRVPIAEGWAGDRLHY